MIKKRYRVLFADDEYWTREKLRNMIPWEEYSLEFLEPAVDGEDAWEKVEAWKPDIFITDINMPFLSGVELLERIQDKYPEIITFVISGYDDFTYVKSSFLSGTMNYLIKPVSKIDLMQAIVKALEKISHYENEQIELQKAASDIRDREFSRLIQKPGDWNQAIAVQSNSTELTGVRLVLIKIHNLHELLKGNQMVGWEWAYEVKKEIRRIYQDEEAIIFHNIYRINEFLILTKKDEQEVSRCSEKLRMKAAAERHACITICIGTHSYAMESLHMAYVEAVGLLMTRSYVCKSEIIIYHKDQKDKWRKHVSVEVEKQMRNALADTNQKEIKRVVFESSGLRGCVKEGWSYLEVKQTIKQLFDIILNDTIRDQADVVDAENVVETVDQIIETLDYEKLEQQIAEAIIYLIPQKAEYETQSMKHIVLLVKEWIQEHYAEELSLSALAQRYHVDSSYLSKMFRQEMGESLILYITHKRVEKAKEYMQNTEMNLADIAFLVGYDDYTYFSRVFKKTTGNSPREYRATIAENRK